MADSVRGDGLLRAHMALAALVEDPERLNRMRGRFSESPPSYRSHLSHDSTLSQSPNPPREEQQRRANRRWQLRAEHGASMAADQFRAQQSEEHARLLEHSSTRIRYNPLGVDYSTLARMNVKERWLEQGIWNDKWQESVGTWKHEEPLEPESTSETDSEAEVESPPFPFPPAPKRRRRKNDEELRRIAERQPRREREREASRPFHQFVYQVSTEREWIQDVINAPKPFFICSYNHNTQAVLQALATREWPNNESAVRTNIPDPPDINAMAYEMVKSFWIKTGIWNNKWGVLPGSSWKHEQPLEEMLREEMGDDATPPQADSLESHGHGTEDAPPRSIFEHLPPAEPNHEVPGMLNTSQQGLPAAIVSNAVESGEHGNGRGRTPDVFWPASPADSSHGTVSSGQNASSQEPGLPNGDANHSSAASHPRSQREESREDPHPPPQRTRRRGNRELSLEGGQISRVERNASAVPARRSMRLQEARRKTATDLTGITAMDSHSGSPNPRLRRIRAGSNRQGVSRRRPRAARRGAR